MKEFYQQTAEEVRKQLNGSMEPLTAAQVTEHQKQYGYNELVEGKRKVCFRFFWNSLKIFWSLY